MSNELKPGESTTDKTEKQEDGSTVRTHEESKQGTPAEHTTEKTVEPAPSKE